MNTSHIPRSTRPASAAGRALAAITAVALIGAACGSDQSDTAELESAGGTSTTTNGPVAASGPVATDGATPPTTDGIVAVSMDGGDIEITTVFDFETNSGTWNVAEGASALGCDGGTLVEVVLATGLEQTMTCDDGPRSGDIVLRVTPEPVDDDFMEFVSDWTVHSATGDFVGLQGGGDWFAKIDADGGGSADVWTGSFDFDGPIDTDSDPSGSDETNAGGDVVLDDVYLTDLIERLDVPDDADGAVMVGVADSSGGSINAADGSNADGDLGLDDLMRVGSITKVFTSLTTLALVEDGTIALDDPASERISRVDVADGVSIRDLLQHTSGIPSYTEVEGFFDTVSENPERAWTPEEVFAVIDGLEAEVEPGAEFSYSNTNYLILGILIEEVTGRPAHEVIRERVIDVVDMPNTYLAGFEDGPPPIAAYGALPGQEPGPIDFDYTSVATSAWTGGAMVSSGNDLHELFTALFDGNIVSDSMVAEMLANDEYGLGLEAWDADDTLVGHSGGIPGYSTLVFHHPESGQTAFWTSTNDALSWGPTVEPVVMAMVPELASDTES